METTGKPIRLTLRSGKVMFGIVIQVMQNTIVLQGAQWAENIAWSDILKVEQF